MSLHVAFHSGRIYVKTNKKAFCVCVSATTLWEKFSSFVQSPLGQNKDHNAISAWANLLIGTRSWLNVQVVFPSCPIRLHQPQKTKQKQDSPCSVIQKQRYQLPKKTSCARNRSWAFRCLIVLFDSQTKARSVTSFPNVIQHRATFTSTRLQSLIIWVSAVWLVSVLLKTMAAVLSAGS